MSDRTTLDRSKVNVGFNRRDWLKLLGAGAAAAAIGGTNSPSRLFATPIGGAVARKPQARRTLRIAHLTDVHVQPERAAAEGLAACLRHVQSQSDKPDIILATGDCVMDSFGQTRARTKTQWDLWHRVWRAECSLPVESLLGNHDIWGWNKKKSKTTGDESGWGKRWACDELGLAKPYRSFDRAGWHFVMLDSVSPFEEDGYTARLDDEQFDWFERDLAAVGSATPVMVLSHIPIFSMAAIFGKDTEKPGSGTLVGHGAMHQDWRRIKALFRQHPNVKLAVSGHLHLVDRVDYGGVSYLCNGAVSGGWWKEKHQDDCDAGYTMIDLYDDGSFDHEYVTYGWTYQPEAKPATTAPASAG